MSDSDDLDAIRAAKREALLESASGDRGRPTEREGADSAPTEPVHVESRADLERLAADHRLVLVDFHADWCGPCQLLEPIVRELAAGTEAAVAKVDVDALPDLAREHRVQGVPTLVLLVDGEPAERLVGVRDYGTLEALVEQHA